MGGEVHLAAERCNCAHTPLPNGQERCKRELVLEPRETSLKIVWRNTLIIHLHRWEENCSNKQKDFSRFLSSSTWSISGGLLQAVALELRTTRLSIVKTILKAAYNMKNIT